jgi:hypothetical protein
VFNLRNYDKYGSNYNNYGSPEVVEFSWFLITRVFNWKMNNQREGNHDEIRFRTKKGETPRRKILKIKHGYPSFVVQANDTKKDV